MRDFDLVLKNHTRDTLPWRGFVMSACKAARPFLKIPRGHTAELGVQIVGPARMRALNRKWRRVDKPTDVLSFPLQSRPIRGYTAVSLGDLYICPAVVRAKAKADGRTVRAQMTWTIVHGLLHLAGYDHERSAAAARRMHTLERSVLRKLA